MMNFENQAVIDIFSAGSLQPIKAYLEQEET
jgi:hypothetical protein